MSLDPNALTDAATVQARLRLAGGTDTALIEQLIDEASSEIEAFTARKLSYLDVVTDNIAPRGGPRISVDRTPLVSIASITDAVQGLVDPAEYAIDDPDIGTIYRERNWLASAQLMSGLNFDRDPEPGTEKRTLTVVYAGGYLTGPQVAVGGAYAGQTRTLPRDLERACILAVVSWYRGDARNRAITSETVGRASRKYSNTSLPPEAAELALRYARW